MRLFHIHRFNPISVQHSQYAYGLGDVTVVLTRCRCGEHKTQNIAGLWDPETFLKGN